LNAGGQRIPETKIDHLLCQCASWISDQPIHVAYLDYMAHFCHAHIMWGQLYVDRVRNAICSMPEDTQWLAWDHIRRNLVIPDIRKLAVNIFWRMEIRPGERELIQRISNNTTSTVYGALQAVRTPEYITRARRVLTYGTLEEIHKAKLLTPVLMSVIQTRMNNRCSLDWMKRCVCFLSELQKIRHDSVPQIIVCKDLLIVRTDKTIVHCKDIRLAYVYWCRHSPSIIDGRYNVSACTI